MHESSICVEFFHELNEGDSVFGVKIACGFVSQDQRRIARAIAACLHLIRYRVVSEFCCEEMFLMR